ncbi:MAG: recombinase family protein, partial [Beijerinckiaceae bacterium]|nr:recombinase family protein [Beijerinckiaceae bacterium]
NTGAAMTPTATKKGSRLYRYYTSMDLIRNRATGEGGGPLRLPAGMVEEVVVGEIRRMVRAPEMAARAIAAVRQDGERVDEQAITSALGEFDQLWAALFPAEQARIVHLLVERVTVNASGIAVDLRNEGLGSVIRDMIAPRPQEVRA